MTARPPAASPRRGTALDWALGLGIVAATAVVYASVRQHAFLNYDDPDYVTDNAHVRAGLTLASVRWAIAGVHHATWHPLTSLSHLLDVELFGLNPGAHLVVNVALHALAALALFRVLHAMTGARWPSAWVAALFALHPLHVESVAWVAERKDVLSGLCWMLTLAAYLAYVRRPTMARYTVVACAFGLGLLAKPMLVTLPFVLLLLDVWPLGRCAGATPQATPRTTPLPPAALVREKVPLLLMAAAVSVVTYLAQRHAGALGSLTTTPLGYRIGNALVSYVVYVRKTLWPTDLAVFYPPPTTLYAGGAIAAALVLAAVSALVVRERRRRPYLLVGWLWYLGVLVPVVGLVRQGDQAMADRFTYLPSIGLFLMAAWAAADWATSQSRRVVTGLAAAATVAACMLGSARQVHRWADSETLFRHALAATSDNYIAHTNLGAALIERGAVDEAMTEYRRALAIAPSHADAHLNLGLALARTGRLDDAAAEYAEAARLNPRLARTQYNWGLLLAERGELDAAIAHYQRALELDPAAPRTHNNLGWALAAKGDLPAAVDRYRQALALAPDLTAAHNNLAVALDGLGRRDEALVHSRIAVELAPDEPRAHANHAALLADAGRVADAVAAYRTALRLDPGLVEARAALAATLAANGNARDAVAEYREVLRQRPDWREVMRALAWLLATADDAGIRNGPDAVTLAERASQGTPEPTASDLDVLAAAYAEAGRFPEAIATAERALARARVDGRTELAGPIETRLDRYRTGLPARLGTP